MRVKILKEAGTEEALLGLSLSRNQPLEKMREVADRLAHKNGGHNKFLESIAVWLDITAPRYWWQQEATYRIGLTRQSESTMYTIMRRPLTQEDFEGDIARGTLVLLNHYIKQGEFDKVKCNLPEGFLQRRIVATNYKVLRHIIQQRAKHRLPEWQLFVSEIRKQVESPQWLPS